MKKFITIISIIATLALTACGNTDTPKTDEIIATNSVATESTTEAEETKVESADVDSVKTNNEGEAVIDTNNDEVTITETEDGDKIATIKTEDGNEVKVAVKTNENGETVIDTTKVVKDNGKVETAKPDEKVEVKVDDNGNTTITTTTTKPTHSEDKPATTTSATTTAKVTEAPKPTTTEAPKVTTPKATEAPKPTTTEAPKVTTTPKATEVPKPTTTTAPAHTHNWVAVNKTVHHDEVGHWETKNKPYTVTITYTGKVVNSKEHGRPTFYDGLKAFGCWNSSYVNHHSDKSMTGANFTSFDFGVNIDAIPDDTFSAIKDYYNCGSTTSCRKRTITETTYNSWDELSNDLAFYKNEFGLDLSYAKENCYEKTWVVDKAAYDETVVDHYECSCGATK